MTKIGKVDPGMPDFSLPPFQIEYHNHTLSFSEVCSELGSAIIVVPLVAILANVAIAKAFSKSSFNGNIIYSNIEAYSIMKFFNRFIYFKLQQLDYL